MTTAAVGKPANTASAPMTIRQAALARFAAFLPLCLLGLVGWTTLLTNPPGLAPWAMTLCAGSAGAALLLLLSPQAAPRRRRAALAGAGIALVLCALLCAGVAPAQLWPRRWDEIVAGVADGLITIPGIASPYRGDDTWVRTTVMLGGTLLAAIAALQAFWPARGGARLVSPVPAAMSLTLMWGVAVIEVPPERPFLSGAAWAVLLAAFLFADRVRPAQAAPAAACVVTAALLAVALAPSFDRSRPWLDLEQISEDVANTGTTGYSWNHDYGPLDWPRDGRELLRIDAQSSAYWKAQALDAFDGHVWRHSGTLPPSERDGEIDAGHPEWSQVIKVRVQGLRSEQFVTAGEALDVTSTTRGARRVAGGTYVPVRGILRRGARYDAFVYTPKPNEGELGRAGTRYLPDARLWLSVELPDARGNASSAPPSRRPKVTFAPFGSGEADQVTTASRSLPSHDAQAAIEGTGLERIYALARRLRDGAEDPYDYLKAVMARVRDGATYTERPGQAENPLDRFLFDVRRGYCQHFSGAMALLLRMGGIPARVAVGFTPGSQDEKTGDYVVRDFDAHSWVEAYFPRYGWATFDPTPATAPPREQSADLALALGVQRGTEGPGGDRQSDPIVGAAAADEGSRLPLFVGVLAALLVLAALVSAALLAIRRGAGGGPCPPELAELERALRICRRPAPAGVTLSDLEGRLGASDDARGYLRALAAQRFATSGAGPTPVQRRALRRELARGLGRSGQIRAWLAIPPRGLRG